MGVGSAESGTFAVVSLKVGAQTVSIAVVGAMALHSHYLPLRLPPPLLLLSLSLSPPLSLCDVVMTEMSTDYKYGVD